MYEFLDTRFRTLEAIAGSQPAHPTNTPRRQTVNYHIKQDTGCVLCRGNHELQDCLIYRKKDAKSRNSLLREYKTCRHCLKQHQNGICRLVAKCIMCKQEHLLSRCDEFNKLHTQAKRNFVLRNNRCFNCLNPHLGHACPSGMACMKCGERHHTSLHHDATSSTESTKVHRTASISQRKAQKPTHSGNKPNTRFHASSKSNNGAQDSGQHTLQNHDKEGNPVPQPNSTNGADERVVTNCHYNKNITTALLATALVNVQSDRGITITLRALIDLGSQSSFITEAACQLLQAKGKRTTLQVAGLGSTKLVKSSKEVLLTIKSLVTPTFEIATHAYVIPKITSISPPTQTIGSYRNHIDGLELADPRYLEPGNIDLLLGVNVYSQILCEGLKQGNKGTPTAQNTKLGWILFGEMKSAETSNHESSFSAFVYNEDSSVDELTQQIRKFWECEEVMHKPQLSIEEKQCESHYKETHERLPSGQYQVRIPFKNGQPPQLGDSKRQALTRFLHLESKLKKNEELRSEYIKVINEYITLNHMIPRTMGRIMPHHYYMPHHAVCKASTTTKVRVVFDASAKSSNGISLNEQMLVGPTIQPKLFSTLARWRRHRYAMTADIEKMYRMIKIHPNDQQYQTVLWRNSEGEQIQEFTLTTVTFGTAAAPYLAIRTLHQLAHDDRVTYPKASEVVLRDFYVDDFLTGADTIEEALSIQGELRHLLSGGGFHLRKWAANCEELIKTIPQSEREIQLPLELKEENQVKALGIYWHPSTDFFTFAIKPEEFNKPPISKRNILSEVAKLFDPLGWIAPCVVIAKILIQKLWISGCNWDEQIPEELSVEWQQYKEQLHFIPEIKIPRWVNTHTEQRSCQLHGFCDASIRAYAATVYIRVVDKIGNISVRLLTAKTKVAPIRPISLPRLELCGAGLLCKLIQQVREDMQLPGVRSFSWTDSKIVLAWLKAHPSKWQTFVANRVVEIQDKNNHNSWHHVPTKDNPADLASRGVSPRHLGDSQLWWTGPEWLRESEDKWLYTETQNYNTDMEMKKNKKTLLATTDDQFTLLTKFSSFYKL